MYKFYNANSKGNFVNDCVVRAISVAERKNWDTTYEELSKLAQKNGILLDDVNFVEQYLDKKYKRINHLSKYVGELAFEFSKGVFLITMDGHITVLIDGVIFDTFDCRNRKIWSVWKVKGDKNGKIRKTI